MCQRKTYKLLRQGKGPFKIPYLCNPLATTMVMQAGGPGEPPPLRWSSTRGDNNGIFRGQQLAERCRRARDGVKAVDQ